MSDLQPLENAFVSLYDQSRMATWGGPDMPSRVDSWLERRFAWQAIKYLRPDIRLRPQVEFLTRRHDDVPEHLEMSYRCKA